MVGEEFFALPVVWLQDSLGGPGRWGDVLRWGLQILVGKDFSKTSKKISSIYEIFCGFPILQKFKRPDVKSKESSKVMAQKCFKE